MIRENTVFATLTLLTSLCVTAPLLGEGCGASSCCGPSCCALEQKPCIDCACYTVPYGDLQCACGFSISVEFLYWYARETNLNYAIGRDISLFNNGNIAPNNITSGAYFVNADQIENFGTSWSPGGRASIGWNMACDGWDLLLSYTYFQDKATAKASSDVGQILSGTIAVTNDTTLLINPWQLQEIIVVFGNSNPSFASIPGWDTIKASWSLYFNVVDLELGRKYWLSRCMAFRPYFGLRGGFIETKLKVTSDLNYTDSQKMTGSASLSLVDRVTNHSWGVGLILGLQPEWHFCDWLILYSHADMALLWGNFKSHAKESNAFDIIGTDGEKDSGSGGSSYELKNSFMMMQPVLDLGLGLRWEETWCCDRYRTQFDIGWEYHVWFDYNHRMNRTVAPFSASNRLLLALDESELFYSPLKSPISQTLNYVERTGNLMLSGLVIRLGFDF